MKYIHRILFILAVLWNQDIQAQNWQIQNPIPTPNSLQEVHFIDAQVGWVAGFNGTILKTTNGGQTWKRQPSGSNRKLSAIQFQNLQSGWAAGEKGTVLKAYNGGANWQTMITGTEQNLSDIHFFNAQKGIAVGSKGICIRTNNGGDTWQTNFITADSTQLGAIHFINQQTGWLAGAGRVLKTTNAGQNWQTYTSNNLGVLLDIFFINESTGWVVSANGKIYQTTNGGLSWQTQYAGTNESLEAIRFADAQNGFALGASGRVLKTTNGGQNWQTQAIGTTENLFGLWVFSSQKVLAAGNTGTLMQTSDGGTSWTSIRKGPIFHFTAIRFCSEQTGWALAWNGKIVKTTNGGQNWNEQASGVIWNLNALQVTDPQNAWAAGDRGTIIRTSNGGQTWDSLGSNTNDDLASIHVIDAQKAWAGGENGTLLYTTNGGQTWINHSQTFNSYIRSIHFISPQKGWLTGDDGKIYRTTNSGQSWMVQNSNAPGGLRNLYFVDGQIGWAVGNNGIIVRTTNGGFSWTLQNSGGTNALLQSVRFSDAQNGWITGYFGTILRTTNAGVNWIPQDSPISNQLNSIYISNAGNFWAAGSNGAILFRSAGVLPGEDPAFQVEGRIFKKVENNCNPGTLPVPGTLIKAYPGPFYGIADSEGSYNIRLPLSTSNTGYYLSAIPQQQTGLVAQTACPAGNSYSLNVGAQADTMQGLHFGIGNTACHFLTIDMEIDRRRPCLRSLTKVVYQNQGSEPATDAFIILEFPPFIRGITSSLSYEALDDSTWRFPLGTVAPGELQVFEILDSMVCDTSLFRIRTAFCAQATIFPAPTCPPSNLWNGANVTASGTCTGGMVRLSIRNEGTNTMADSSAYSVFMDSLLVRSGKVQLAAGDSLVMLVANQGMDVYLSVIQVLHHPFNVFVSTHVEACGPGSAQSPGFLFQVPANQQPQSAKACLHLVNSRDPNDKQAFPQGFTSNHVVPPGTELTYKIRFQNTGTDTAYTVYIIDTLDPNLAVESLKLGPTSHPCKVSLQTSAGGKTFLKFQFDPIKLPDSLRDEPNSHGFIRYKISPRPGIPLGTQIRNLADIYFDYNEPVRTNQTLSTIDNLVFTDPNLQGNVQIISSRARELQNLTFSIFPNPLTKGQALQSHFDTPVSFSVSDALGKLVFQQNYPAGDVQIPLHLPRGMYHAEIRSSEGFAQQKLAIW